MNSSLLNYLNQISNKEDIIDNTELHNLIKLIKSNFPPILYEFSNVQKELYILYEIVNNLKKDEYFIPNVFNILINHLSSARNFFYVHLNAVSKEFKTMVYKYSIFYDLVALRSDVLEIFFFSMFLNTDPKCISNYNDYYYSIFKLITFTYLKNRIEGFLNEDETPTTIIDDTMHVSNRCKIFEDGIKLSQIYYLCHESDTLRRININFNEIRNKILPNDFQKLYSVIIEKNNIRDNKFLILKFNLDEDLRLIKIQQDLPVIYKLLRSIKVKSKNRKKFSIIDRGIIKKHIKDIVLEKIQCIVDDEYSEILAESISRNLESSITNGDFLDPFSLTVLQIDTNVFITQLKSFLNIVLENIQVEELQHVGN